MKEFKKYFSAFLITTLGFIPFIPDFGVIDLIATHFFYITIIQILISLYLLILGDYIPIRINKIDINITTGDASLELVTYRKLVKYNGFTVDNDGFTVDSTLITVDKTI